MLSEQEVKAEARVKALLSVNRKKSVHVSLFSKTHIDFKKFVVSRDLSMQEVFEHFACQASEGHPALIRIIDDYCSAKKANLIQSLEEKYAENLYDVIGDDNPFGE